MEDLSANAGVSPSYLIRCFRRQHGIPPHAYQLQVRLQRAKSELSKGVGVASVAVSNGYFDPSHYHRHFKRAFEVTPGEYRNVNSVQAGQSGTRQ